MDPFNEKHKKIGDGIVDWKTLAEKPYDKNTVSPYTKLRIILMNGTEFESVGLGHHFMRHAGDMELRRELALIRRVEQQQQKRLASLKPADESILEHTIGYEHLAVDLTIALAMTEPDPNVKSSLDFALLEDFDHLYRYSNLLYYDKGVSAENLIGCYAEIMPGRPTISEHRFPFDDVTLPIAPNADMLTKLHVNIITAAEQQTMNYYMNVGAFYDLEHGRRLYSEIGMIEEQHVTRYGGLKDPGMSWLECLLMHEYTECYLYLSCASTETDPRIRSLFEEFYEQELAHLAKAADLLEKYDKKDRHEVIPNGDFPTLLELRPEKEYLRNTLQSVWLTADRNGFIPASELSRGSDFYAYQDRVNANVNDVPSHAVIAGYIKGHGIDYRYQDVPHPIPELNDRKEDNTTVGRGAEAKHSR